MTPRAAAAPRVRAVLLILPLLLLLQDAWAQDVTAPLGGAPSAFRCGCVPPAAGRRAGVRVLCDWLAARAGWPNLGGAGGGAEGCTLRVRGSVVARGTPRAFAAKLRAVHRGLRISRTNASVTFAIIADDGAAAAAAAASPRWALRGHQIAQQHHLSMFRDWEQLAQFATDLSVFGTNAIEVAHVPDPFAAGLLNVSRILDARAMRMSVWWSAAFADEHAAVLPGLFSQLPPSLDMSLFFPGGDGGTLSWDIIGRTARALRQNHRHDRPSASGSVWVSAQEVNASALDAFTAAVRHNATVKAILGPHGGVVYGPHNRVPLTAFVASMPGVSVRQYPDLAHSLDAQFPMNAWDAPWIMAYNRQVVNPRPLFFADVVSLRANGSTPTAGVGAYSEGLNDDLNKFLWSRMGSSSGSSSSSTSNNARGEAVQVVHEYARYFFGADAEADAAAGLLGLEQNWVGRARDSGEVVASTLASLERAAAAFFGPRPAGVWRMSMYLRRALMDAYVQAGHVHDLSRAARATSILGRAGSSTGCARAVPDAIAVLASNTGQDPRRAGWLQRILNLTESLNATVGAEVVQTQDTRLNLATLHVPERLHSDWLLADLRNISAGPPAHCAGRVAALLNRTDPGPGGFYDACGSVLAADRPHLVDALAASDDPAGDPSGYAHAVQGGFAIPATVNVVPAPWQRYAMSFFDAPLVLRYTGLRGDTLYRLRIVYWPYNRDPVADQHRLVTKSGYLVHDYLSAPRPTQELRFDIPGNVTGGGTLTLLCERRSGLGGNGMTCEVSEVWLVVR